MFASIQLFFYLLLHKQSVREECETRYMAFDVGIDEDVEQLSLDVNLAADRDASRTATSGSGSGSTDPAQRDREQGASTPQRAKDSPMLSSFGANAILIAGIGRSA